jgi:glycosyltransferase involved in cell wall biosynthesis
LPLSIYHKYLEDKFKEKPVKRWPPVSIIIPAHNEEKVIGKCIESVLAIDYPNKEIIVVDDGSTDRTYELAIHYQEKGIKLFRRPKASGKSVALNTGLMISSGEIIITCDADSQISKSALRTIV